MVVAHCLPWRHGVGRHGCQGVVLRRWGVYSVLQHVEVSSDVCPVC